jgi:hypothetical protein
MTGDPNYREDPEQIVASVDEPLFRHSPSNSPGADPAFVCAMATRSRPSPDIQWALLPLRGKGIPPLAEKK